jgi:hypothetical protein
MDVLMPRSKRTVRASGVSRSLTGKCRENLIRCLCCGRWLPREAIGFIRRKPYVIGGKTWPGAFCGECYQSGKVWRDPWKVELDPADDDGGLADA